MLINRLKALKKRFLRKGFSYCIFHTLPTEFFNFAALKMNKEIKRIVLARVVEGKRALWLDDALCKELRDFVQGVEAQNVDFEIYVFWPEGEKKYIFDKEERRWKEDLTRSGFQFS